MQRGVLGLVDPSWVRLGSKVLWIRLGSKVLWVRLGSKVLWVRLGSKRGSLGPWIVGREHDAVDEIMGHVDAIMGHVDEIMGHVDEILGCCIGLRGCRMRSPAPPDSHLTTPPPPHKKHPPTPHLTGAAGAHPGADSARQPRQPKQGDDDALPVGRRDARARGAAHGRGARGGVVRAEPPVAAGRTAASGPAHRLTPFPCYSRFPSFLPACTVASRPSLWPARSLPVLPSGLHGRFLTPFFAPVDRSEVARAG
eukprot:365246-Chlamydomonas_euryale.AAC.3